MLKALASKHFVRVQDARGQTSHFTLTTYRQLSQPRPGVGLDAEHASPAADAQSTQNESSASTAQGDETLEGVRQQAYEQGLNDGRQQAQSEQETLVQQANEHAQAQEAAQTSALLNQIQSAIQGLHEDASMRYEPLKRLAVHLAEQLVLAELSLSSTAIQSLIERCVDALDQPTAPHIMVELHPDDLSLLQSTLGEQAPTNWRLLSNAELLPGSVQVSANDAMVRDLIEHRLEALARDLLLKPQEWKSQTAFSPERLQMRQRNAPVQDVISKEPTPAQGPEAGTEPAPAYAFELTRQDLDLNEPPMKASPPSSESPTNPDEDTPHDH
jgi:flagellar biosynthesis/type III secretory pathway protein FliH